MAGCYGNSFEDRYWESRLFDYLDEEEDDDDEKDVWEDCLFNQDEDGE